MWIYICDSRQIICVNSSALINQRVGREKTARMWRDMRRQGEGGGSERKIKDERERVLGRWREGRESSFRARSDWTDTCSLSTRSLDSKPDFPLITFRRKKKLRAWSSGSWQTERKLKTPTFGWLTLKKKHNIIWAEKMGGKLETEYYSSINMNSRFWLFLYTFRRLVCIMNIQLSQYYRNYYNLQLCD